MPDKQLIPVSIIEIHDRLRRLVEDHAVGLPWGNWAPHTGLSDSDLDRISSADRRELLLELVLHPGSPMPLPKRFELEPDENPPLAPPSDYDIATLLCGLGGARNKKRAEDFWALVNEPEKTYENCVRFVGALGEALRVTKEFRKTLFDEREKGLLKLERALKELQAALPADDNRTLGELFQTKALCRYKNSFVDRASDRIHLSEFIDAMVEWAGGLADPLHAGEYSNARMTAYFDFSRAMESFLGVVPEARSVVPLMALLFPSYLSVRSEADALKNEITPEVLGKVVDNIRRSEWYKEGGHYDQYVAEKSVGRTRLEAAAMRAAKGAGTDGKGASASKE